MTVSQYRKAARAFTNSSVNVLYVMSIAMIVLFSFFPPVAVFFDGASFSYVFMCEMQFLMYTLAHMALSESHPVFEGTEKPKNGLTLSDMRGRTALYQLPAGRETVVRSYIGIDGALSGMIFFSAVLFGAVLIIKPAAAVFSASAFLLYLIPSVLVLIMENSLRSGDVDKIAGERGKIYFSATFIFCLEIFFDDKLNALIADLGELNPVPSMICGILCIILGIVSMIILNGIHKGMLSDCPSRSISGEFIERNDENA
ncbi:MAG: hypothetical protein ACI4J0_06195 [Huintestinicola sp.]|uniref:hypothetical protein n=1 Tax=Huintestinicola sp. TaxID=2981661 RepID=UPI003F014C9C